MGNIVARASIQVCATVCILQMDLMGEGYLEAHTNEHFMRWVCVALLRNPAYTIDIVAGRMCDELFYKNCVTLSHSS